MVLACSCTSCQRLIQRLPLNQTSTADVHSQAATGCYFVPQQGRWHLLKLCGAPAVGQYPHCCLQGCQLCGPGRQALGDQHWPANRQCTWSGSHIVTFVPITTSLTSWLAIPVPGALSLQHTALLTGYITLGLHSCLPTQHANRQLSLTPLLPVALNPSQAAPSSHSTCTAARSYPTHNLHT